MLMVHYLGFQEIETKSSTNQWMMWIELKLGDVEDQSL